MYGRSGGPVCAGLWRELGGVETLITYPTTQTHADVPEEVRLKNGITPCTLRVSVGIEDIEDLLAELTEVFKGLK